MRKIKMDTGARVAGKKTQQREKRQAEGKAAVQHDRQRTKKREKKQVEIYQVGYIADRATEKKIGKVKRNTQKIKQVTAQPEHLQEQGQGIETSRRIGAYSAI